MQKYVAEGYKEIKVYICNCIKREYEDITYYY